MSSTDLYSNTSILADVIFGITALLYIIKHGQIILEIKEYF